VAAGQSVQFAATIENAANSSVTWQWTGPGVLDSTGKYTAPNNISSETVTVTATSVADPTKKASVQFTIAADALITTQGPATLPTGGQLTVAAQLTGVPTDSTVPFILSYSNAPLGVTCVFNPAFVTGQNPSFTMTFRSEGTAAGHRLPLWREPAGPWPAFVAMALLALALAALNGSAALGKRSYACVALVFLCLSVVFLWSCSGISSSSVPVPTAAKVTPPGRYQLMVRATPQSSSGGFVQTQLIIPFTVN
jgi:hypothetical protein